MTKQKVVKSLIILKNNLKNDKQNKGHTKKPRKESSQQKGI